MKATATKIAFSLVLLAPLGAADVIQGRVVDSLGAGVQSVDIDALNLDTGNWETLLNDGTNASGDFVTTIPAGRYQILFLPPPPPATTHLVKTLDEVIVVGTVSLGTIALPAGVSLAGRCVSQTSVPAANVNLDVLDQATNQTLVTQNDFTDSFGNFLIAVPASAIEVRFDATGVPAMTLASIALDLSPTANTNLGDVVLPPGYAVTGTVARSGSGTPVSGADLDFWNSVTGIKAYTPNDNTQSDGSFSVVVAAATWDVEIEPRFTDLLVAEEVLGIVVAGPTSMGTISLDPGVVLYGNVIAHDGSIPVGSDVDVRYSATGQAILTPGDNTNAQGNYQIVVPTGVLDVTFNPPNFSYPLGADLHAGVVVAGTMALNGVLPPCLGGTNYGAGKPGTGGVVPHLSDSGGAPRPNNVGYAWELQNGRGGAVAILVGGSGAWSVPFQGGTLLVDLTPGTYSTFLLLLGGTPGAAGGGSATFPFPTPILDFVGLTAYGQFAVLDPGATQNLALSDGMAVEICL
ncbi:MAG: hypothetical protein AB1726_05045 [Planctomycetota bacterium]